LVKVVFLFAIAFSRVGFAPGNGGGKGNSWLGRGLPEAHLRVFTLLLIKDSLSLNQGCASPCSSRIYSISYTIPSWISSSYISGYYQQEN